MIFGIKVKKDNFDPYNVFLSIATNIPQRLKTQVPGLKVQGHIYINCTNIYNFFSDPCRHEECDTSF